MSYDFIDFSWVKQAAEDRDDNTYLCPVCSAGAGVDAILHKVTDPAKLEFAGGVDRYECLSCGYLIDATDGRIRRQEKVSTILPPANKPNPPIFETVKAEAKDKLRGSGYTNEFDFNLDPGDLEQLRHEVSVLSYQWLNPKRKIN